MLQQRPARVRHAVSSAGDQELLDILPIRYGRSIVSHVITPLVRARDTGD